MNFSANIIRSLVSCVMSVLLVYTLSEPKYSKKIMFILFFIIIFIDTTTNIYFFNSSNLTILAKFDVLMYSFLALILKPFFKENLMQWLFNFITMLNVFFVIIVISYLLSYRLPVPLPIYLNTFIRFILFSLTIYIFQRYLRPQYKKIIEHWEVFFIVVIGIFFNFAYYIYSSQNIQKTLSTNIIPLFLLILLSILCYVGIFKSIKTLSKEILLKQESLRYQSQIEAIEILQLDNKENLDNMKNLRHDLNHHLSVLSAHLNNNDCVGALSYIREFSTLVPQRLFFSENIVTESFILKYKKICSKEKISFSFDIGFNEDLISNKTMLSILLGNSLQNAIEAVRSVNGVNRYISLVGQRVNNTIILIIKNGYNGDLYPNYRTTKKGGIHGFGLASMKHSIEDNGGYLDIEYSDCEFTITFGLNIEP